MADSIYKAECEISNGSTKVFKIFDFILLITMAVRMKMIKLAFVPFGFVESSVCGTESRD